METFFGFKNVVKMMPFWK